MKPNIHSCGIPDLIRDPFLSLEGRTSVAGSAQEWVPGLRPERAEILEARK